MKTVYLGDALVDSGQLMIMDPCYVAEETTQTEADDSYNHVCTSHTKEATGDPARLSEHFGGRPCPPQ